ncbi:MAG: transposase [Desulfovibrio sp.]|nr:transposase [Desulfovibrio sp.]
MDITNEQWERLAPLLSDTPKGARGQDRPVLHEPRAILDGILWILRAGAPWKDLPERCPPYRTCHRWFQRWRQGIRQRQARRQTEKGLGRGNGAKRKTDVPCGAIAADGMLSA